MAATPKAKPTAKPGDGEDQSMEEILQSIRKIIADEGGEPATAPTASELAAPESDILELTESVEDDGSVVNMTAPEGDVLSSIDNALAAQDDPEPEPDEEEPAPVRAAAPKPAPRPAAPKPAPRKTAPVDNDGLVSNISIAAAAEAMRSLRNPGSGGGLGSLAFMSGETVEGLVAHLLRPMLKDWLDANLPVIVQQEVQREVQRITESLDNE